jgi:lipopolysaccharide biosynthesis glycosyltransferase
VEFSQYFCHLLRIQKSVNKDSTIHIACAADDSYTQHMAVMLTSILETNSSLVFYIHLFSTQLKQDNLQLITKLVEGYGSKLVFYQLDESDFSHCVVSHHVSIATYYRILIPHHLQIVQDKVLYLDTDMLVNGGLDELWNVHLGQEVLAAVKEPAFNEHDRLSLSVEEGYFNAGVLLINIRKWLQLDLTNQLLSFIQTYPDKLIFWDQDALNAVVKGRWIELNPKWNNQTSMYELPLKYLQKVYGQHRLAEALTKPSIIHFTGSSKPWHFTNLHPFKGLYYKYLDLTPWRGWRPTATFRQRFAKLLMKTIGVHNFQRIGDFFTKGK